MSAKLFIGVFVFSVSMSANASLCEIKVSKDFANNPTYSVQLDGLEHKDFHNLNDAREELSSLVNAEICYNRTTKSKCEIKPSKDFAKNAGYGVQVDNKEHKFFYKIEEAKKELRALSLGNVCLSKSATSGTVEELINGTLSDEEAQDMGEQAADAVLDWLFN